MRSHLHTLLLAAMLAFLATPGVPARAVLAQAPGHGSGGPELPEVVEGVDYRVYDRSGQLSSLSAIVEAARSADAVLVGEEHDDMIGHAFQAALLLSVIHEIGAPASGNRQIVFSMEMFERDVQYVLDEYLAGLISEDHLMRSARPWPDYEARYRPLVEIARAAGVPIVAANAPRRYVSRVSSEGPHALDDLSEFARGYLPPLPYPGPSRVYREQWDALMVEAMEGPDGSDDDATDDDGASGAEEASSSAETAAQGGGVDAAAGDAAPDDANHRPYAMSPNVIQAQALWDAAMGHAVTEALVRHVGGLVLHIAGSFHVERQTGIPERIADYRPGTRVVAVVMTDVDDIDAWSEEEHGPLGDFVVLTRSPQDGVEGSR